MADRFPLESYLQNLNKELNNNFLKVGFDMISIATIEIERAVRRSKKKGGKFPRRQSEGAGLAGSFEETLVADTRSGNIFSTDRVLTIGTYSALPYADIQDRGDTISSRGPMLAIPLTSEALNRGSPLNWSVRALRWVPGKKRGRKKKSYLVDTFDIAQYALRDKVKIRGKKYLQKATKRSRPKMEKLFFSYLANSSKKAKLNIDFSSSEWTGG